MEFKLVRKLDICGGANAQFQDYKYRILHPIYTLLSFLTLCTGYIYQNIYCYYNYYFF